MHIDRAVAFEFAAYRVDEGCVAVAFAVELRAGADIFEVVAHGAWGIGRVSTTAIGTKSHLHGQTNGVAQFRHLAALLYGAVAGDAVGHQGVVEGDGVEVHGQGLSVPCGGGPEAGLYGETVIVHNLSQSGGHTARRTVDAVFDGAVHVVVGSVVVALVPLFEHQHMLGVVLGDSRQGTVEDVHPLVGVVEVLFLVFYLHGSDHFKVAVDPPAHIVRHLDVFGGEGAMVVEGHNGVGGGVGDHHNPAPVGHVEDVGCGDTEHFVVELDNHFDIGGVYILPCIVAHVVCRSIFHFFFRQVASIGDRYGSH